MGTNYTTLNGGYKFTQTPSQELYSTDSVAVIDILSALFICAHHGQQCSHLNSKLQMLFAMHCWSHL